MKPAALYFFFNVDKFIPRGFNSIFIINADIINDNMYSIIFFILHQPLFENKSKNNHNYKIEYKP